MKLRIQVRVTVQNVNRQPGISGDGAISVNEGETKTTTLILSDPDTEDAGALTVSTNQAALGEQWPSWLTVTPSAGSVSIQAVPGLSDAGNYSGFSITVSDPSGATAKRDFTVAVGNVNQPPEAVISSQSGPSTATAGFTKVKFDGSDSSDPDGGALTYTWDVNGTTLHGPTAAYVFPTAGTYNVSLTVSDGDLSDVSDQTFRVTVIDENPDLNLGQPICGLDPNGTNPINHATGNKYQREVDYVGGGAFPLTLTRHYNSRKEMTTALGQHWRHSYERTLDINEAGPAPKVDASRPEGTVITFYENSPGSWDAPPATFVSLNKVGTQWKLAFPDNSVETYDALGQLLSITTPSGMTQTLTYLNGKLGRVTGPFGQQLLFAYDPLTELLTGVSDPASNTITYSYNGDKLTGVAYQDNKTRTYHYENTNYPYALTGITDENNNRFATWRYDGDGRAYESEHANGVNHVAIDYASSAQSVITDAKLQTRTYSHEIYNGQYRTTHVESQCSSCGGSTQNTTYDDPGFPGLPNIVTDFANNQTDYDYNGRGLEIQRIEAKGSTEERTIKTTWHASFRLPECVIEEGRTTDYEYNANGRITRRTEYDTKDGGLFPTEVSKSCDAIIPRPDIDSLNKRAWEYIYYPNGLLHQIDGPRTDVSDIVTYTYHPGTDNLASIENPLAQTMTFALYDAHGRPREATDPNGLKTKYTYTSRGWVDTVSVGSDAAGYQTTDYDYDGVGNLDLVTYPYATYVDYVYDDAHRLTDIYDTVGNHIHYTLDLLGNREVTEIKDPTGVLRRKQSAVINLANRLEEIKGAAGQRKAYYEYYDNGQLSLSTDSVNQTDYQYDGLNRLKKIIDAKEDVNGNRGETLYIYDAQDRLTAVTDPKGTTTTYGYDGLGNRTSEVSHDRGTTQYTEYDGAGNLLAVVDAGNKTTRYRYDVLNRIDAVTYNDGTASAFGADYIYDSGNNGVGRLTTIQDNTGSTSWTYDLHGRTSTKTETTGAHSFSVAYGYDGYGRLETITYPSNKVVRYTYTNGQVTRIAIDGGQVIMQDMQYDPFGPLIAWNWGSGRAMERNYNQDGQLDTYSRENATYDIDYYATGTLKDEKIVGQIGQTLTYTYDELLRVTDFSGLGFGLSYEYDANGNRELEKNGALERDYIVQASGNRLESITGAGAKSYSYDLTGSVTGDGTTAFNYDARNRLVSLNEGQYRYQINELGQRVAKEMPIPGNADGNGVIDALDTAAVENEILGIAKAKGDPDCTQDGIVNVQDVVCIENLIASPPVAARTTVYYVYNESGALLGEYGADGSPLKEYVWLGGMPVAIVEGDSVFYIHSDHLNTPRAVTDSSDVVVWRWPSDPFGAAKPIEDPDEDGVRFVFNVRFAGQYFDRETGLHYNYFRDYDPGTGRYLESDPIGLSGGLNTYGYVTNDPINWIDPLGLMNQNPNTPSFGGSGFGQVGGSVGGGGAWIGLPVRRLKISTPKIANGPRFPNLKDHAHRHSNLAPNAYYNQAVRHTKTGTPFRFYHKEQFKRCYITRKGPDEFLFTSTNMSGNTIFTHMPVNGQYLSNIIGVRSIFVATQYNPILSCVQSALRD